MTDNKAQHGNPPATHARRLTKTWWVLNLIVFVVLIVYALRALLIDG